MPSSSSVVPNGVRLFWTVVIALALLLGFLLMFATALLDTLGAQTTPSYTEVWVYVATGLASFVGGVFAVAFGQPAPGGGGPSSGTTPPTTTTPTTTAPAVPAATQGTPSTSDTLRLAAANVATVVFPSSSQAWRTIVGSVYVSIYVLVGLIALVIWITHPSVTPDIVKNLAVIALGLFMAIATTFVR